MVLLLNEAIYSIAMYDAIMFTISKGNIILHCISFQYFDTIIMPVLPANNPDSVVDSPYDGRK